MKNRDTGILVMENNIKLHRMYFKQMVKLLGINVKYWAPIEDSKSYNLYGEMQNDYVKINAESPEDFVKKFNALPTVGCIYDEHPTQKTMRKLGWNAELADANVLVHVPYDLEKLQAGCIFAIPAGNDIPRDPNPDGSNSNELERLVRKWRLFRVIRISNTAIYPASVTCELGPLYIDNISNVIPKDGPDDNPSYNDFRHKTFTVLDGEQDEYGY